MHFDYSILLQSQGFQVKNLMQTNEQCYEDILSQKPEFIIIDSYQFPIETREILAFIRCNKAVSKVISLSECKAKVFENSCNAASVDRFLAKSQQPEDLFRLLQQKSRI